MLKEKLTRYDHWEKSNSANVKKLKRSDLFKKRLLPDIRNGLVFPAIRQNKAHFYFQGQKLFEYSSSHGFQTNVAYIAAFSNRPNGEVRESGMRQLDLCKSFVDGYEQIKKNVGLYRQPESGEVSDLCEGFSYARSKPNPIVVLDIELSLKRDPKVKVQAQDRIDLTLFNTKKKAIRFFEVKTFGNGEIWPKPKGNPKVMQQVSRYVKQATSNNEMLLASYKQYVRVTNELFGQSYQAPENVEENVDLLVFDFDHNQRRQIKETLIPLFNSKFRCSFRGHAKGATNSTLSKWWNKK